MTDKEFIDIATALREQALRRGRCYPLDTDEAEDIAQDTMLRLWALRSKIVSADHAAGLASIIAAHTAIDLLRRRRQTVVTTADVEIRETSGRTPLTDIEDRANDAWLQRQLSRLPSTEYEILHLRQVEQKSNGEIAAILGITPQSVATLLSRARHKLLEKIQRDRMRGLI